MRRDGENLEMFMLWKKLSICTFNSRFDLNVVAIEQFKDLEVMTIDELQGYLQVYEKRLKKKKKESPI